MDGEEESTWGLTGWMELERRYLFAQIFLHG
jgi:hypothetical protein